MPLSIIRDNLILRISDLNEKGELSLFPCPECKQKYPERILIHHKKGCKKKRLSYNKD